MLRVHDAADFKVHIMRTRRSAGFMFHMGTSSFLLSREFLSRCVPYSLVTFGGRCAQIMYGFFMRPDTLPKSYVSWWVKQAASRIRSSEIWFRLCRINTAGQIPKDVVSLNHDIIRTRTFNPVDLENILSRPVCLRPFLLHHLVASTDPYAA